MTPDQIKALLKTMERLAWEPQYSVRSTGNRYDEPTFELVAEYHQCRFCGVVHIFPHKNNCQIKQLAAMFGAKTDNPNATEEGC